MLALCSLTLTSCSYIDHHLLAPLAIHVCVVVAKATLDHTPTQETGHNMRKFKTSYQVIIHSSLE